MSGWTWDLFADPINAWIAKYSAGGRLLWKKELEGSEWDEAYGMALDRNENLFTSGWTRGSLGGPQQGGGDPWIAKFSIKP
jgi:hypothetical protein